MSENEDADPVGSAGDAPGVFKALALLHGVMSIEDASMPDALWNYTKAVVERCARSAEACGAGDTVCDAAAVIRANYLA